MNKKQILLLYLPVIHQGYLDLITKQNIPIGILAKDLLAELPCLARDVRALNSGTAWRLVRGLHLSASVFDREDLIELVRSGGYDFVLPDDELSRIIADKYLQSQDYKLIPAWLRWDRQNAMSEEQVDQDRRISIDEFDRKVIIVGQEAARHSSDWWRQVGAGLVFAGVIEIVEFNHHLPTEYSPEIDGDPRSNFNWGENIDRSTAIHAEAAVIAQAARQGLSTLGTSLYVTTFPCGPCARLVAEAGIKHVYYAEGYSRADAQVIFKAFGIELVKVEMP